MSTVFSFHSGSIPLIQDPLHILPENLFLKIDRIRIEQVITNLLLNAIKNTPPYGKISVNLEKNEECVEISMKDTGVGLTNEEMEILFTRFGKIERSGEWL